jgi:RNA polymerase sigma-70 factor, ECF subfamily
LYDQYSDSIYSFIFFLIGDKQKAEDLTHDTFLRAFNAMHSFEERSSEKTWLYSIARNVAVDELRKSKVRKKLLAPLFPSLSSKDPLPEDVLELSETNQLLYQALNKLQDSYRLVIYFRKIKELSITETAQVLNWKESNVKTQLHRGLKALKKQMVKEGYSHEAI